MRKNVSLAHAAGQEFLRETTTGAQTKFASARVRSLHPTPALIKPRAHAFKYAIMNASLPAQFNIQS
ncbi:MAG TPA: hypothetical protein VGO91_06310 [Pyrinomonadaceae bacterium]|nr:hypothetical protein [Pyrinomonadaceae bacterium]